MNRTTRIGTALVAGALALGGPGAIGQAHATLGGNVASIQANQEHLGAQRSVEKLAQGERHELRLNDHLTVQEYVSPSGVVYAITWKGHGRPNFGELFGSYASELENPAARNHRRTGHHQLRLSGSDFELRSSGHNRMSSGRAWVPSLLPAGGPTNFVEMGQ